MFRISISKKKHEQYKMGILVFLTMLFSLESLMFGSNNNEVYNILGAIGIMCLGVIVLYRLSIMKLRVSGKLTSVGGTLIFLSFLTMMVNGDIDVKYFYVSVVVLYSMFFVDYIDFRVFIESYCRLLYFVSAFSIIIFVVWFIAPEIIRLAPSIINKNGSIYYNTFFCVTRENYAFEFPRNMAFFREPGVYSVFLCLAIAFELFYLHSISIKRLLIYVVAIVTSYSTTGFIVLAIILILYCMSTVGEQNKRKVRQTIAIVGIVALLFLLFSGKGQAILTGTFSKLFANNNNNSTASRFDSVFINLKMVENNLMKIFVGNGFLNAETLFVPTAKSIGSYAYDNVNTIFRILSTQGLAYVAVLILGWINMFRKNINKKYRVSILLIFVVLLFTENIMLNPILFIFAFYGFKHMAVDNEESSMFNGNNRALD